MPHFGTLKDFAFKDKADDIRGADLHGVDGSKLGKIDDVIFEHGRGDIRYVVVDTGGWWSSKRFMVPAERIHRFEDGDGFQIDAVKEHIERYFPPYDAKHLDNERDWNDYENKYRTSTREHVWKDDDDRGRRDNRDLETSGGVMHRDGSDRMLTPEAHEMPMSGAGSQQQSGDYQPDTTPRRIAGKFSDGTSAERASWTAGARHDETGVPGVSRTPFADSGDVNAGGGQVSGDVAPAGGTLFNSDAERDRKDRDETRNAGIKDRMKQAMGSQDGDWKPDAMERDKGEQRASYTDNQSRGNIGDRVKHAMGSHDGDWKPDAMERDKGSNRDDADERGYNQLEGRNDTFAERYMGADPSKRERVHVAGGERGEHHIADNAPRAWSQEPVVHESKAEDFGMKEVQHGTTQTGHWHENRDYQGSDRGERWNRFEELLRRNRVDIESRCRHCEQARDKDAA